MPIIPASLLLKRKDFLHNSRFLITWALEALKGTWLGPEVIHLELEGSPTFELTRK